MNDKKYSYARMISPMLSSEEKQREINYCRLDFMHQIVKELPFDRYFTIKFYEDYRRAFNPDLYDEIRFSVEIMEVHQRDIIIETPIHTFKKIEFDWHKKEWWKNLLHQQKRKVKRLFDK